MEEENKRDVPKKSGRKAKSKQTKSEEKISQDEKPSSLKKPAKKPKGTSQEATATKKYSRKPEKEPEVTRKALGKLRSTSKVTDGNEGTTKTSQKEGAGPQNKKKTTRKDYNRKRPQSGVIQGNVAQGASVIPKKKFFPKKWNLGKTRLKGTSSQVDSDGKVTRVEENDTASEMPYGSSKDAILAKPLEKMYSPETLTGFREMPGRKLLTISILWLPRLFIPWMEDWHEYNVFILVNPDLFGSQEQRLFEHDMILLGVKCAVSIICSVIADFADMRLYIFLALSLLFFLCPLSGGVVDMVLRSRTYDQHYYERWLWSIVMMRWAMAIPFVFTPVQFASIFSEKSDMSRKAHYNWIGILFFFEFVNACISFWVIPSKCPTKDWIQIAVWLGIGMLMFIEIFFTFVIFLAMKDTRTTFLTCLSICHERESDKMEEIQGKSQTENASVIKPSVRLASMKLMFLVLMLIPLLYMSFVFSTLDRFLPDDDWDKHRTVSATSMFVLGKVIGVVLMVFTMFAIRKLGKLSRLGKMGKLVQKVAHFKYFSMDVMVLGLPHLLNILALVVLVGRFEALTKGYAIKKGRTHYGPIPDKTKTVILFFNLMLSNRTICVGSEHFRSVKIRPFRYAAIELFDPGVDTINITITPEPGSTPLVATSFAMTNFQKGRWVAYVISVSSDKAKYIKNKRGPKNYYAKPRQVRLKDNLINTRVRPNFSPLLIIVNSYNDIIGEYNYWIKYEGINVLRGPVPMQDQSTPSLWYLPQNPYIWQFVGCCNYSISINDPNTPQFGSTIPKYTFRVNSIHRWPIYYLVSYLYEPIDPKKKYNASELPMWFKLFMVAETARWDNKAHLPDKTELQQDWAIKMGLSLAGMAEGGVFVGVIYVFWMDMPFPFPATTMAVFWAFWALAAEPSRLKLVDIDPPTESIEISLPAKLLMAHIPFTALHFAGAIFFYHAKFNFRRRPD